MQCLRLYDTVAPGDIYIKCLYAGCIWVAGGGRRRRGGGAVPIPLRCPPFPSVPLSRLCSSSCWLNCCLECFFHCRTRRGSFHLLLTGNIPTRREEAERRRRGGRVRQDFPLSSFTRLTERNGQGGKEREGGKWGKASAQPVVS